jgi:hypothetical protein
MKGWILILLLESDWTTRMTLNQYPINHDPLKYVGYQLASTTIFVFAIKYDIIKCWVDCIILCPVRMLVGFYWKFPCKLNVCSFLWLCSYSYSTNIWNLSQVHKYQIMHYSCWSEIFYHSNSCWLYQFKRQYFERKNTKMTIFNWFLP